MSPIRCARAALAIQAQGTPLAHKKYFVMLAGTPTFEGTVSVFNSLRASGACASGVRNATRA